jgi:hypothetical protein
MKAGQDPDFSEEDVAGSSEEDAAEEPEADNDTDTTEQTS